VSGHGCTFCGWIRPAISRTPCTPRGPTGSVAEQRYGADARAALIEGDRPMASQPGAERPAPHPGNSNRAGERCLMVVGGSRRRSRTSTRASRIARGLAGREPRAACASMAVISPTRLCCRRADRRCRVDELRLAVGGHQHLGGLDVAVQHASRVRGAHRAGELDRDIGRVLPGHGAVALQTLAGRHAGQVVHDEVGPLLGRHSGVNDANDVRMLWLWGSRRARDVSGVGVWAASIAASSILQNPGRPR
jgi:hypothetical protein